MPLPPMLKPSPEVKTKQPKKAQSKPPPVAPKKVDLSKQSFADDVVGEPEFLSARRRTTAKLEKLVPKGQTSSEAQLMV